MTTKSAGVRRPGRAAPMPPDERRKAIVDAVVPLLVAHGRGLTTRQIAEGAGIAEGTIFRVFESKDELIEAALVSAFEPAPFMAELRGIDRDLPLRDRLVAVVTILQKRFIGIFALMRSVGLVAPPEHLDHSHETETWRAQVAAIMVAVIEPDVDQLRVPPERVLHVLRLLTFSGSHADIADKHLMTPEEIVDVVLHGMLVAPRFQDTTGQDTTGQDTTGQDTTGQDTTGQDTTGRVTPGEGLTC